MTDNELIKNIIAVINDNLSLWDMADVKVKQGFQPTQQGVETGKVAYLHKLFDHKYGFPFKSDKWVEDPLNPDNSRMVHTETQPYETTFQITALAIQNPRDTNSQTASDIANLISSILTSDFALKSFSDKGIRILRIMDVRDAPFVDDKDRFEFSPSFDFVLTHDRTKTWKTPYITKTKFNFNRV